MFTFRNLSIRRKQTLIIMLTSSVALLLACGGLVAIDILNFRKEMVEQASTTAQIVGNNCAASLDFNDPKSAGEILAALRAEPNILAACIYDRQGDLFSMYTRGSTNAVGEIPAANIEGHAFVNKTLRMFKPVTVSGETFGTVYLAYDLVELDQLITRCVGVVAVVLMISLLVAFGLSIRLQRLVSTPILGLTKMTRAVAVDKNYSVRATKHGSDELGELIDGFNDMLSQIQARDAALEAARENLEGRVKERTAKLAESLSLLNATLESTTDGILATDLSGKIISFNTKFAEIWNFPADMLQRRDMAEMIAFSVQQLKNPEEFLSIAGKLHEVDGNEILDVLELKDGRIFERYALPQYINGQRIGIVVNWRDVTERKRAEEAALQSQALYHSLVDQMPVGIFRKDSEGRYVFVNSFFCQTVRLKPEQYLGKVASEVFASDITDKRDVRLDYSTAVELAQKAEDHHALIMRTGQPIELEEKHVLSDGTVQYLHVVKTPVFDSEGRIIGTQGVQFDISARKAAEAALLESQALYDSLVEHLPAGVFRKDKEGRFVFVNSWFCRLKGMKAEQLLGKTPRALAEYELSLQNVANPIETRETKLAVQGTSHHELIMQTGQPLELEEEYPGANGQPIYLRVVKSPVFGSDGRIAGTQGMLFDVTESKSAQAELAAERELLRALLDNSPDQIYFKDLQSRFIKSGKAQAQNFGVRSAEELLGKSDFDFFSDEHARPAYEDEQEIIRTGRPLIGKMEKEVLKDGRITWVLASKMALRDKDGNIIGTFGISKDITALKQTEHALAYERDLLKALMDHFPDSIYFKDLQSRFVRVSKTKVKKNHDRALEQHRLAHPDEDKLPAHLDSLEAFEKYIIGKTDFDFLPEQFARDLYEVEQEIIRTGKPQIAHLNRALLSNGQSAWFLSSKLPWHDQNGKIIGTFGTTKEITDLKQAQEEAAREQARLKFIFDSVPVGISLAKIAPDGRLMERLINNAHLDICGITREQDKGDFDIYKRLNHPDDDRRQKELQLQLDHGKTDQFSLEKRYLRFDGRTAWVIFSAQRRKYPDGTYEDLCTVVDITKNKQAEEDREKLHRQLIDASRSAGMAEVASNVLHNVGNVLNSVNVSATLAADIARKSKAASLAKAVALLDEHASDLGAFFANDAKGAQLHGYLRKLSEQLANEQQASIAELESLRKNIEHIKDIVTMQQSYAKMSGVKEVVPVIDLVEDSLRMNDGALKRHDVSVVREFEDVPPINIEKHKVLQILVNLIRNAKYACDEGGRKDKQLTVRITNGSGRIKISVADNGVGIPAENLTRIFNHGFTTRKTGHGFGLHSGALAAKEMGGALFVHSEGQGYGATFTLELPAQTEAAAQRDNVIYEL